MMSPHVTHFFDAATYTLTYVVTDTTTGDCAIIDPVLNLDYASGAIGTDSADQVIAYIKDNDLNLELILETHIHADHLSSAPYLQSTLGVALSLALISQPFRTRLALFLTKMRGFDATVASLM